VVFVDAGRKGLFLLLSIFCSTLLAGCLTAAGGTDVTALASSLPQVKQFLNQFPNAKITVALWDSAAVQKNIDSIRADCGQQFAVGDYYRVSVADPSLTLVVWLDKSTQNVMCAVKSAGTSQVPSPGTTTVPPASSTTVPSEEVPPMPPESSVEAPTTSISTVAPEVPPLPPEEELTYEEYECVKNGGHWNPCASPCEGEEDTMCAQMCVARCEYPKASAVPPEEELTYEEYECVKNGGHWNPCASPCEGREDRVCIQVCVARCEYANQTYVPPAAPCVSAGNKLYTGRNATCCSGLVLHPWPGSSSYGIAGYCTYPVPPVAPNCSWVPVECSYYGAYWDGKPIECNLANEGTVGMGPSDLGDMYLPESYTRERWSKCFTPRAVCRCGNVTIPTASPAPTQIPSPSPSPSASVTCNDTDGGVDFFAKGTTRWGPIDGKYYNATDGCDYAGKILSEVYCYYSGSLNGYYSTVEYYACPNGCSNGACIATPSPSPTPVTTINCSDTDGGLNYYVPGNVTIWLSDGSRSLSPDFCLDSVVLRERYCYTARGTVYNGSAYSDYSCPNGCSNGACIATPSPSPTPSGNYSCGWVDAPCSYYGAYWTPANRFNCTIANNGTYAMVSGSDYYRESYTTELWSRCFTSRARCSCFPAYGNYSAPSAGTGLVTSESHPWWCFWCGLFK
jgi:predicted small secreted protein